MNIIFRPWSDRRRLGEEKKRISPYRRGMRFLMLMRYRGGQPPSHHTVVTSDVRNSFLPEMPKVHCDKPAPKEMALNKICKFFVFLTSFLVFFLDGARTARCFFPAVRAKRHFSIPSRRRKIKTKKAAVPSRVALVVNFVRSPSPRYAVFFTAEKIESARYGGRASVRTDTIANLRKSTYLR